MGKENGGQNETEREREKEKVGDGVQSCRFGGLQKCENGRHGEGVRMGEKGRKGGGA